MPEDGAPVDEEGCYLVAVAAGAHPTLADAVAAMTSAASLEPDPASSARCDERYRRWRGVYDMLLGWTL